ncbi:MAG: serine/threonine protein kinase, partial [Verrucomicrobiaceae bacterium]|nr:serine/threonine protein kinase [Verrucomicrobiaceae bacterium]
MTPDPFAQQTIPSAAPRYHQGRKMFGGRYTLLKPLGRGGMGEVWLAQDNELGVQRALKFAPPEVAADARSVAMLKREAIAGTSLAHPNIVRILDFVYDTPEMESAVVMEVVEGKSLADLQAKRIEEGGNGFFEPEEIEKWLRDACAALDYAHGEGRVHRDIKPQNLMVESASGRLKIMDFGISRRIGDSFSQLTGKDSSGTLPYMSPQQLDGGAPSAADDVYSLGATVYELLTGTPPFFRGKLDDQIRLKEHDSLMERRRQNAQEGLNAGAGNPVSKEWEVRVSGMLNKKVEARRLAAVFTQSPPKKKVAEERPRKAESPPPAGGDNLEQLIELLRKNGPTPFMLWLLVAFIIQVALGYYAWERAASYYEGGMDFWRLPGGVRLVIQSVLFLLFYLPLFLLGRRFKTAPWSPAGTALVFACWSCFPMAAHVLLSGRSEWSTWFYAGTVYRLVEVNLVASGLTGIFWHLALRERFIRPASADRLRRVTLLQTSAFIAFVSLVVYC